MCSSDLRPDRDASDAATRQAQADHAVCGWCAPLIWREIPQDDRDHCEVKRLFAILLMLAAVPAQAEWILLIVTLPQDTYYVDPATKTSGKKPRVTTMINGRSRETWMSNKVVWEADCERRRVGQGTRDRRRPTFW
mgnify:CR=1 FL=1